MRDPRALPVLRQMLTENLPPDDEECDHPPCYYGWRGFVPPLLGAWGDPSSIPALRHALQAVVRVELTLPGPAKPGESARYSARSAWIPYEESMVYALGRLGAAGALTGIEGAESHVYIWRVHRIMGYLHGRYAITELLRWAMVTDLAQEVSEYLERRFGLDRQERARAMQDYQLELSFDITEMYRTEHMQAEGKLP